MKRSKHSLSHYVLSTFDMGKLIPVGHYEVLPGDSVRQSTSALLRVSPLMAPVMHPVSVRLHHWYVPFRLIWPGGAWERFITGGPDGNDSSTPPKLAAGSSAEGNLWDYFGVPPNNPQAVNQWPLLAYKMIWNEFYRDQDLQPEDTTINPSPSEVCWEKDYFTSARPWTQKGPDVVVPIGQTAPVVPATPGTSEPKFSVGGGSAVGIAGNGTSNVMWDSTQPAAGAVWSDSGLVADLALAVSPSVNDFRLAFALQRYQEARAQYGSRYTEYLRYLGVKSSDARLQRPEYLGGGKATISFSEVLRTGRESDDTDPSVGPIGEMKGHGISALRSRRFVRFFEEHGIVMTLCSIRPRAMYQDGLHRSFTKATKEDYWQKELEQVGQQAVRNDEVYAAHSDGPGTFGFQDRYAEYRHQPSRVCGQFRSTMSDWHLARQFTGDPALNAAFVECAPSKRIHAEQTQHVIWGMFSHSIQARRLVGKRTIGRIF